MANNVPLSIETPVFRLGVHTRLFYHLLSKITAFFSFRCFAGGPVCRQCPFCQITYFLGPELDHRLNPHA